jgi:hypothetical protein
MLSNLVHAMLWQCMLAVSLFKILSLCTTCSYAVAYTHTENTHTELPQITQINKHIYIYFTRVRCL